mmetsp:Transcript_46857/g.85865  ORF Transcript_46857/g.85865 Transcript_46857/m.85865 type:complete len:223 (+) Transcript_46857:45-713(+)
MCSWDPPRRLLALAGLAILLGALKHDGVFINVLNGVSQRRRPQGKADQHRIDERWREPDTIRCLDRRGVVAISLCITAAAFAAEVQPVAAKPPRARIAQDKGFREVTLSAWVTQSGGQPDLVLGLRGEPYYLLPGDAGASIKNFALKAECTHLGCLAEWRQSENKFVCPCHGSEYDAQGKVLRGPAPSSLALSHVDLVADEKVQLSAWLEEDFRDGLAPWWL